LQSFFSQNAPDRCFVVFGDYHKFGYFVILSLLQKGDPTGCKAQAVAKNPKKFKIRFKFIDTSANASL